MGSSVADEKSFTDYMPDWLKCNKMGDDIAEHFELCSRRSRMTQMTPPSYLSWKICRKDSQVPMIIQVYNFTYLEKVCWEIRVYSTMNLYDSYYPEYLNSIYTALFEKRSPECQKLILEQCRRSWCSYRLGSKVWMNHQSKGMVSARIIMFFSSTFPFSAKLAVYVLCVGFIYIVKKNNLQEYLVECTP